MAVNLVTGKPGSYKSAYVMSIIMNALDRPVYVCNFRGLQIDSLKALGVDIHILDDFSNWRDCPDRSLICVDELQEFSRSVATKAKTEDLPEHFTALEKHRHRGMDFYFITQHPMYIHTHIRRLLENHIHFQRSKGLPYSVKREWQSVCDRPEDMKNATSAMGCTVEMYRPDKNVFDFYESTVQDTHKLKVPRKLYFYGILIGFFLILFLFLGSKTISYLSGTTEKPSVSSVVSAVDPSSKLVNALPAPPDNPNLGLRYDPSKPFDYHPIDTRQPSDFPKISGVIIWEGKCHAYSQQGTKIDLSQENCFKFFKDRPFDYFGSSSSSSSAPSADVALPFPKPQPLPPPSSLPSS